VNVGVRDQQARHARPLFMSGNQFTIIVNGCARTEAANQAKAASLLRRCAQDNGTLPT